MPVLEDVSFAVADLEFVAIVGPSGCGKSTFLRIVNGLIPPDSGTILIDGRAVTGPGHGVGMVFQSFDLFPWRTAIGNVEFGMEMMNVPQRECRERARAGSNSSGSPASSTPIRTSCPAACSSASASPARWRSSLRCC